VTAATDEFFRRGESKLVGVFDGVAGFPGGLTVDEDLRCHDRALGLLTAFTNPPIHQRLIHTSHARRLTSLSQEITPGFLLVPVCAKLGFAFGFLKGGGEVCAACKFFLVAAVSNSPATAIAWSGVRLNAVLKDGLPMSCSVGTSRRN
jgi:hypothetical protein